MTGGGKPSQKPEIQARRSILIEALESIVRETIQGCDRMELTYSNIIEHIIDEFPQLIHEYKNEYEWANTEDGLLTYLFFGPIVREHFYKLATRYCNEKNKKTLLEIHKFSELFENMATSNDVEVHNLLVIGLFEGMDPILYEFARSILGPESKKLFNDHLEDWHRPVND